MTLSWLTFAIKWNRDRRMYKKNMDAVFDYIRDLMIIFGSSMMVTGIVMIVVKSATTEQDLHIPQPNLR